MEEVQFKTPSPETNSAGLYLTEWEWSKLSQYAAGNALAYMGNHAATPIGGHTMSNVVNFNQVLPMTRRETEQSAAKGRAIGRTLAPLHPGETFRFPIAVRAVAHAQGIHTAAECAQEWAPTKRPPPIAVAMVFVKACMASKPMVLHHAQD